MATVLDMDTIKKLDIAGWIFSNAFGKPEIVQAADEETEAFLVDWREYQAAIKKMRDKYPWIQK